MSDIQLPPVIFGPTYQARIAHRPVFGDECVVCGKRCSRHPLFEVRLDAALDKTLAVNDPTPEDGGLFPVGAECARAFPVGYLHRAPSL